MIATAGGVATNHVSRQGVGDFPLNTGSWSVLARFKYGVVPVGYGAILALFDGSGDFSDPYVFIGSSLNTSDVIVEAFDGSTTVDSTSAPVAAGAQHWVAVTYNGTTHDIVLIVNGVAIDTVNLNLSSLVWDKAFMLGDDSAGTAAPMSAAYSRAWNALKSLADLTLEAASMTALDTGDLLWDTPLQTGVDLTDHSGHANQWTYLGTVTTNTSDPLLSVIAGPPTNTSPNTALEVTTESAVFLDTLTAGAATDVWFKITAPTGTRGLGGCNFGDLVTYRPSLTIYEGLANALSSTRLNGMPVAQNRPNQFPTTPGTVYYLKSARNGAVSPATVILSVVKAPQRTVPRGSILINDSSPGYPVVAISSEDGTVLTLSAPFAAGESVRVLTDGRVMAADDFDVEGPIIYDGAFPPAILSTPTMPATGYEGIGTDQVTGWWAVKPGGGIVHAFATFVSRAGANDGVSYDMSASSPGTSQVSPNLANTILYFYGNTSAVNKPVQQIVLGTLVVTNFVAADAAYFLRPGITTMTDGSVLVGYGKTNVHEVRHFSAAGALLHTFAVGGAGESIEQLFTTPEDPLSFGVWTINGTVNRFRTIRISDGATLIDVTSEQFIEGVWQSAAATAYNARFGTDFSCVPWITRTTPAPVVVEHRRIRRLRRFPLPFDRNFWMFINRIEFEIQAGVGNANEPGLDPQLEIRFSGDGGNTWGDTIFVPMGKRGEYNLRQVINNIGALRNGWCEVVDSDPVKSNLLACYIDADESTL